MEFRDVIYVSDGRVRRADIFTDGDTIVRVCDKDNVSEWQNAPVLIPGVIDEHIHSREPGMTHKGDLWTETRAAAAGGVTSVMDMPNVVPPTTTVEAWQQRMAIGEHHAFVNYAFHFGATNTNAAMLRELDVTRVPAVKLFMGSSTGGMLVDREEALQAVFERSPLPVMTHCEDTAIINANMRAAQERYGDDPPVVYHLCVRSREACVASTSLAVRLARETGARLHIAHITTADELALIPPSSSSILPRITAEACVPHLLFSAEDYSSLGTRIKCNPSVKDSSDREAIRRALTDGRITTVATDHAPHLLSEKQGGCRTAVSGMPMVQFSLASMMQLVQEGIITLPQMVALMCHNPARLFDLSDRGYIREGMKADFVLLAPSQWTLTCDNIISRCGWSPLEGRTFSWRVASTFVNGTEVYRDGRFLTDDNTHARALRFSRI